MSTDKITDAIAQLQALADVSLRECMATPNTGTFGALPSVAIGAGVRFISVVYRGPVMIVGGGPGDEEYHAPAYLPAETPVRAAFERLALACRKSGVGLHLSHAQAGVGCWYQYTPPVLRAAARLAEDIRVTRIRAAEWPGVGHEERLASLMARV